MTNLETKILRATKWSTITEIVAKIITPITTIVLARILAPDAFGILTTITMVIAFAEIFTDAGFQKYIIQHDFTDLEDRDKSVNVAFWSNLLMSLLIWLLIALFSEHLASLVGNPGLGHVLIVASVSIPIAAFSSIQMALYKRDLEFKTLFKVRLIGTCVPLLVTIPLAFYLRNYWALVIGTIAGNTVNAVFLTIYSKWRPRLFYSFALLREMFSFSALSVVEAVTIWMTGYVDVFIIGRFLNEYYLGIYKTSISIVGQLMGIITAATTPILFSSLSRLQTDEGAFKKLFFRFQELVGLLVIPLGVGIFCYSDLLTSILLGNQWMEASHFIGIWGLSSTVTIVFSHYSSEVFRAKGRPGLSVLSQFLHLIVLCPAVMISVKYGFQTLVDVRALVRLEGIAVNLLIMSLLIKISPMRMIYNVLRPILASIIMGIIAFLINDLYASIIWQIASIIMCIIVYFSIILLFPSERKLLMSLKSSL